MQKWLNWRERGGQRQTDRQRGREGGRKEEGREKNRYTEDKQRTKENKCHLFICGFLSFPSPIIQNRPRAELAAAWRMVGRVSQEWGAKRPRMEPILKFSGACKTKEVLTVASWYPRIFPTLDIKCLIFPYRCLEWKWSLSLPFKCNGRVSKQACRDSWQLILACLGRSGARRRLSGGSLGGTAFWDPRSVVQGFWILRPQRPLLLEAMTSPHFRGVLTSASFASTLAVIWKALSLSYSFCETSHIRKSCWSKSKCPFLSILHIHSFSLSHACSLSAFSVAGYSPPHAVLKWTHPTWWVKWVRLDWLSLWREHRSGNMGLWAVVWLTLNISWQSAFTLSHITVLSSFPRASMDRS